jgi:hypothetical protein
MAEYERERTAEVGASVGEVSSDVPQKGIDSG